MNTIDYYTCENLLNAPIALAAHYLDNTKMGKELVYDPCTLKFNIYKYVMFNDADNGDQETKQIICESSWYTLSEAVETYNETELV